VLHYDVLSDMSRYSAQLAKMVVAATDNSADMLSH
jgi:hypothetical protein